MNEDAKYFVMRVDGCKTTQKNRCLYCTKHICKLSMDSACAKYIIYLILNLKGIIMHKYGIVRV